MVLSCPRKELGSKIQLSSMVVSGDICDKGDIKTPFPILQKPLGMIAL